MTVFIVYWRIPYEGSLVQGVYSTREKAMDEIERLQRDNERNLYEVEEEEVK